MEKSQLDFNSEKLKTLISDFNQGMTEKPKIAVKGQASGQEISEICLPPLLVEAFQSGVEDGLSNCGCGEEHDCSHHASGAGHQGCGGCHHHD